MIFRTELDNGVVLSYGPESEGKVRFEFPTGESVETTWEQIAQLQAIVSQLGEAYQNLLSLTQCERPCPFLSVDLLGRLDQTVNPPDGPQADSGDQLE